MDGPFTNTFTDNPAWRGNIFAVNVNGIALTNTAYAISAGQIVFTPSKSALLQSSSLLSFSINATGFGTARYAQPLVAGVATKLAVITQASGPSASGGTLVANPSFLVSDQYGNGTTNPYANVSITASVGGSGGWTLGGDTIQTNINGVIAFTNPDGHACRPHRHIQCCHHVHHFGLSGPDQITNSPALGYFGATPVDLTPGNLAVLQPDANAANTTFSIIEAKPGLPDRPLLQILKPTSATGTNGEPARRVLVVAENCP